MGSARTAQSVVCDLRWGIRLIKMLCVLLANRASKACSSYEEWGREEVGREGR
jgi:hypothetical protein